MEQINFTNYFYYDESSPSCLRWKIQRSRAKKDSIAGTVNASGYYVVTIHQKSYRVHRLIMFLHGFELITGDVVDHADGNLQNNKVANLRITSQKTNMQNQKKHTTNTSGKTGVSWSTYTLPCGAQAELYARATWNDTFGKGRSKGFAVKRYGLLPAFKFACEHRDRIIESLNSNGANYSERHGLRVSCND